MRPEGYPILTLERFKELEKLELKMPVHRLQDCFLPVSGSLLDLLRSWHPSAISRTLEVGFETRANIQKDGKTTVCCTTREEYLEFMHACAQPIETVSQEGAYSFVLHGIYESEAPIERLS